MWLKQLIIHCIIHTVNKECSCYLSHQNCEFLKHVNQWGFTLQITQRECASAKSLNTEALSELFRLWTDATIATSHAEVQRLPWQPVPASQFLWNKVSYSTQNNSLSAYIISMCVHVCQVYNGLIPSHIGSKAMMLDLCVEVGKKLEERLKRMEGNLSFRQRQQVPELCKEQRSDNEGWMKNRLRKVAIAIIKQRSLYCMYKRKTSRADIPIWL